MGAHSDDRIERTLTAYLQASVRKRPDGVAVSEIGRQVTYAELDEISNCVACVLVSPRPIHGERVGIWLNKSVEAIAAIHAVLRGGAAYVPIDPTAPPRRAATVLADCAASWLITTPDRLSSLHECSPEVIEAVSLICVGQGRPRLPRSAALTTWEDALARHAGAPRVAAATKPIDIAYILYTSGSTGVPKGVALTHENARSFVDWGGQEFGLTREDVLASHAPLHFDLSILDVFGAAACGGAISLVPESWQGMGGALVRFVADQGISVWYSVPSALRRMAEAANSNLLSASRLRVVAFAGEEYPIRHLRGLLGLVPAQSLVYNLYGPTETNVCTFHRLGADDLARSGVQAPPIGLPCPYATAFLIAENGAALPDMGEAIGELCIGGPSVMKGYWNNPSDTAKSMIRRDGAPFYRTGDIVRRLENGMYVFVGRDDGMVKVKGHRIELGEIESALDSRADVEESACVVVRGTTDAAGRIVAFLTLAVGARPDQRDLRRHCRELLPSYMVPERFEVVPALIYTSTGKIDRKSLARLVEEQSTEQLPPMDRV
jgi:amino acid adenylation domain-containing protein